MQTLTLSRRISFVLTLSALVSTGLLRAVTPTATWTGAVDGDLGKSGNWTPVTTPYTPQPDSDLVFGSSASTDLTGTLQVGAASSFTFLAGAPSYTYHVPYAQTFQIDGGGILNNSGVTQTLSIDAGNVTFQNSPVLTNATIAVNGSTTSNSYGALYLFGTTSAGNSTIINNAGTVQFDGGGFTTTAINSTLGSATVINNGGVGLGGFITINGSAGSATLIANGGLAANQSGGGIRFQGGSGSSATITVNGGSGSNSQAGGIVFQNSSTAGNATVTLNGGTSGGGGAYAYFYNTTTGGSAKFVLNTGSTLDIGQTDFGDVVSFGSVEGAGRIYLGGRTMQVGSLNTDTTISGLVSDMGLGGQTGGSLDKVGTGKLTLTNDDTYTGPTTVSAGTLSINGSVTSNVEVKSGATLKGIGTVYGAVTVDAGGILSPGNSPGTITMRTLSLNDTSILDFELGTVSDRVAVTTSGGLTLDGILNISDSGGFDPSQTYTLFTASGSVTDNGLQIGSVPAGYSASDFAISVVGTQVKFAAAVPEPGEIELVLAGLGFCAFVGLRRPRSS